MNRAPVRLVFAAALFLAALAGPAFSDDRPLVLVPGRWEIGTLEAGNRAFLTLQVTNTGSRSITLTVIPTCDCLSTGPSSRTIAPGGHGEFRFSFLAEQDESGDVRETYLVLTDLEENDHFYYQVHGVVTPAPRKN